MPPRRRERTPMNTLVSVASASQDRHAIAPPARRRLVLAAGTTQAIAWVVPVALLALWQIASSSGLLSDDILPSPAAVVGALKRLALSGELATNVEVSFLRAVAGLAVGGGIGLALGLANGMSKLSEAVSDSTIQMVRTIPHLALIPLVILWFGIGEEAKLFLVALGTFFPIYANTVHGIRSVDPQLIEMGRSYGMSPAMLFRRVILPGALPSIFVGLRYALGIMWLTLIVAETIAAQSGIGYMAMQAREFMQTDVVVLSILIYAVLGKLADSVARWLERTFLAWNPAYRRGGAA
jgi:sulfonate transport system permease protein